MTPRPAPGLTHPLIAILRGVTPDSAGEIAAALVEAGLRAIEVPLNSPDPFTSIERIRACVPDDCLIGAGTVLEPAQVDRLVEAGGTLMVSPNVDPAVLARGQAHGLVTMPGVFTATEALLALRAGASALKFFPASVLGPAGIRGIMAVLPPETTIGAVGGVSDKDFGAYRGAGIHCFGLGSSLYRPGDDARTVGARARAAVAAYAAATPG